MVSRNLERANENDGFKMTALEYSVMGNYGIGYWHRMLEMVYNAVNSILLKWLFCLFISSSLCLNKYVCFFAHLFARENKGTTGVDQRQSPERKTWTVHASRQCVSKTYVTRSREMSHLSKISISIFLHHFLKTAKCFILMKTPLQLDIWLQNHYFRYPTHSSWSCHILSMNV